VNAGNLAGTVTSVRDGGPSFALPAGLLQASDASCIDTAMKEYTSNVYAFNATESQ
jgi:hypothetical protein